MPSPDFTGRFAKMREYLSSGLMGSEGIGESREEKSAWIHGVLEEVKYEFLGREEKGLVRQYITAATGYSRAQVERYFASYRKRLTKGAEVSAVPAKEITSVMSETSSTSVPVQR